MTQIQLNAAFRLKSGWADDFDDTPKTTKQQPAVTQFIERHGVPIRNVDEAIPPKRFGLVVSEIDKVIQTMYARGVPCNKIQVHEINLIKGKSFRANGWDAGGLFEDKDGYGVVSLAAGLKFGDQPSLRPGGWSIGGTYLNDAVRHEFGHGLVRSLFTFGGFPNLVRSAYV
jgi:hypothetical protein